MQRHCYKLMIPAGFVKDQLKETEIFIRSWPTERTSEDLLEELTDRLKTVKVIAVSKADFEIVALNNCLAEPRQMELFENLLPKAIKAAE